VRVSDLLGLVYTDVCGPMSFVARGGFQYFITFSDDFSRYGYIYLIITSQNHLKSSKNFIIKYKFLTI
jgi:hypothetical protein